MTLFLALATLLVVAAATLLALPLLRRPRLDGDSAAELRAANVAIFRDQLSELEHDRNEGSLAAADFEQARSELQRRLLEEVGAVSATADREARPSRKTALAVVVLLPLAALLGYAVLGTPQALDPTNTQPQRQITAAQVEGMVERLAQRLAQNPDDPNGWVMLARSYKMLGRYAESAEAYGKGFSLVEKEPALLADYAEMLAISGQGFAGKPSELLAKAMALAPDDPQVLLLSGAAAGERGEFERAATYWEKALVQFEPGSEEAEALKAAIAQAHKAAAAK